jgi:hypothetical protein
MRTRRHGWLMLLFFAAAPVAADDGVPPGLPPPPGEAPPGLRPAAPELDRIFAFEIPGPDDPPAPDPRGPRKASSQTDVGWGALSGSVAVVDTDGRGKVWEDPLWKRTWRADESWRCPVIGPVTAFGQVGGSGEEPGQSDMSFSGRTGLACKVPVWVAELQLRGGPGVRYTDPLRPDRSREQTDFLVEVQARCPLVFGIGLEYQATALPALTPLAQDQLNQDLRLALPFGTGGKFKVGARRSWQGSGDPHTWSDSTQLYLGLELAR